MNIQLRLVKSSLHEPRLYALCVFCHFYSQKNASNDMDYGCVDLLPQSPGTMMRDTKMRELTVKILSFLIEQLIEALCHFYLLENLDLFDPHVGDTACQIRAYQLILLYIRNDKGFDVNKRLSDLHKIKERLKRVGDNQGYTPNNQITISDFINEIDCYFSINKDERFLLQAYFLTTFKKTVEKNITCIDYDLLANKGKISRKLAKKIARHHQLGLAKSSCHAVLSWSYETKCFDYHKTLQLLYRLDDDGRPVLACYFLSKVLHRHLTRQRVAVLAIVERSNDTMLLLIYPGYNQAINVTRGTIDFKMLNSPCFIISGECVTPYQESDRDFLARFNAIGLEKVVLANMAAHPQYSGHKLEPYKANPFVGVEIGSKALAEKMNYELEEARAAADSLGCSQNNPSLFLINHIYCDTAEHYFNSVGGKKAVSNIASNTGVLDMLV